MTARTLQGILGASGLTHAQLAAKLGTSQPRMTTYANGTVTPSGDLLIEALIASGTMPWRHNAPTADSTAHQINKHTESVSEQFRWILEGRDYLQTASPLEAITHWGSLSVQFHDPRWRTFLAALVRPEFDRMKMTPPAWTNLPPLAEPWQPSEYPLREDSIDPAMLSWGIRVRTKDLVNL